MIVKLVQKAKLLVKICFLSADSSLAVQNSGTCSKFSGSTVFAKKIILKWRRQANFCEAVVPNRGAVNQGRELVPAVATNCYISQIFISTKLVRVAAKYLKYKVRVTHTKKGWETLIY